MNYYYFLEIDYIWQQKKSLKGNPSDKYHLSILDKREAKEISNNLSIKIKNKIINLKSETMSKKGKKK